MRRAPLTGFDGLCGRRDALWALSCIIWLLIGGCSANPDLELSSHFATPATIDLHITNTRGRPLLCANATLGESVQIYLSRTAMRIGDVILLHRNDPDWRPSYESGEGVEHCWISPGKSYVTIHLSEYYVRYRGEGELRPVELESARDIPVEPFLREYDHVTVGLDYSDGKHFRTVYTKVLRSTSQDRQRSESKSGIGGRNGGT